MIVQGPDGKRIEFPDGTPPEVIQAAMARQYGGPSQPASAPPMAMTAEANPAASWLTGMRSHALEALPAAGGFLGGLGGAALFAPTGPAGMYAAGVAGAGLGGAAGEGLREAASGEPISPQRIGIEGAQEGGLQALGGALAGGAGKLARPLMRRAMGVGQAIGGMSKIGGSKFPDVVETGFGKQLNVSAKDAAKATGMRSGSAKELRKLLNRAEAGGKQSKTHEVTKYAVNLLKDPAIPGDKKKLMVKELLAFWKEKGEKIPPTALQKIKKYYQDEARAAYKAGESGIETKRFAKAMARGAREQLETIPGVAARNAETRSLMGVERALERAVGRAPRALEIQKPSTYPLLSAAMGPHSTSFIARQLAKPGFQAALRQSPRLAAEVIAQLTQYDAPDATNQ